MALYLPITDGHLKYWDVYIYNPKRKFKGAGFIIMIQEPGTKPMTDSGTSFVLAVVAKLPPLR